MQRRIHGFIDLFLLASRTSWFVFAAAALLGGLFFVYLYGLHVLDPRYIDWLLPAQDLKQHYEGWSFFRRSEWSFPVGMISNLGYPFGIPITFMDSIPLVAIPMKLISPILPLNFQYFGLWGLLCYMLQGGITAMIIRHWTKDVFLILICATMLIFSPILTQRMFVHTALASQWIILASIWALVEWRKLNSVKRIISLWSVLLCIAVLVHPYFFPMVAALFCVVIVLSHRNWISTFIKLVLPLVVSIFIFWIIGGFAIQEVSTAGKLGEYAFNLNALINPLGWSKFLAPLPTVSANEETLNYLGLGVIILIPLTLYLNVSRLCAVSDIKVIIKKINLRVFLIGLIFLSLLVLAVSPTVQLGGRILFEITLPGIIEDKWSIFRATARLFWPLYYIIVIGILVCVVKFTQKSARLALYITLGVCVLVQATDIGRSTEVMGKRAGFKSIEKMVYKSNLQLDLWQKYIGAREHIVYLDSMDYMDFFALVDVAEKYKLTLNTAYSARVPEGKIKSYQAGQKRALIEGSADVGRNLFLTKSVDFVTRPEIFSRYKVTALDSYYIIQ